MDSAVEKDVSRLKQIAKAERESILLALRYKHPNVPREVIQRVYKEKVKELTTRAKILTLVPALAERMTHEALKRRENELNGK